MKSFSYEIKDPMGIHARPAGLLVKAAGSYESAVRIAAKGKEVDAKRIMAVMGLGVKTGDKITVTAEGTDEAKAVGELEKFIRETL